MLLSTCLFLCLTTDIKPIEPINIGFDISNSGGGVYVEWNNFTLQAGGVYEFDVDNVNGFLVNIIKLNYKF